MMKQDLEKQNLEQKTLFEQVVQLIETARQKMAVAANLVMVQTYFEIGRRIVEDEQQGNQRADYGKFVIQNLSIQLSERFGEGFSQQNLRNMRQFFTIYKDRVVPIRQTPSGELLPFTLSWSHYLVLMRIDNADERRFYEIEATKEQWSEKFLKRQYHSSLYERLALSRDKEGVLALAKQGQTIQKPQDILKNPLTLEFLGCQYLCL